MDALDACVIKAGVMADQQGDKRSADALWELQAFERRITHAHAKDRPLARIPLMGESWESLHEQSHHPAGGHLHMGRDTTPLMAQVNELRTVARTAERAAVRAFSGKRDDLIEALNLFSSAVYVLLCRMHAGIGSEA